jgi:hypothetical protein
LYHDRQYIVALLNLEPLGSRFVGGKRTDISIILGSFPHRKKSQAVQ